MTVYLGDAGIIELARSNAGRSIVGDIDPADVNTRVNRFSFNYKQHEFNTGDLLEFTVIDPNGEPSSTDIDFVEPCGLPRRQSILPIPVVRPRRFAARPSSLRQPTRLN